MLTPRVAIALVVVATLLAIVCHPRVFYGDGSSIGFSIVNLDRVFYAGQWGAFVFALVAVVLSVKLLGGGNSGARVVTTAVYSSVLLLFLLFTGVPHKAFSAEWRVRKLGIGAFIEAVRKQRKESTPPVQLSIAEFAGTWRAEDGTQYKFSDNGVSWSGGPAGEGAFSQATCGTGFSIVVEEQDREVLIDHGLTWSSHAVAVHDSTPAGAKIPTALVICGNQSRWLYIRATPNEVWIWTSSMDANDFKGTQFVLRRANGTG